MEDIINKFKFFIIKQANKYRIPSYDFQDLIQYGNLSVIKAVKFYEIGNKNFTTYCTCSVINNFNALLKSQIKHNREIKNEDILMLQVYDFQLEDEFINNQLGKDVVKAFNLLEQDERKIITEVYFNDKTLKQTALEGNINYSKAYKIKKNALNKLKKYLE
jgi:RNA polymerase sporulation-specific sigma factor